MSTPVSVPGMVNIAASRVSSPPGWALLERELISLMEEAAVLTADKHTERGGAYYFEDDQDDYYEATYNWGLFYAMGADDRLLDLALQQWNANTRINDDRISHRAKHQEFYRGKRRVRFRQQIHNEYYNSSAPGDWGHMGEGNMAFYDFGVACPTISENVRRSKRFAAMFMGEDPEAPNYDPAHKVFRSPYLSSQGPLTHARDADQVDKFLLGTGKGISFYGVRASLYPVVEDLEVDWYENPDRREEIVKLFDEMILQADAAYGLGATALMTNAYLYTGDEKYKEWVLDYTEAWIGRTRRNDGIIPDNVGPTGQIGESRGGQWWGGLGGWNHYNGFKATLNAVTIAAECALLLTGDFGYLELLRSQIKVLLDNSETREDGQLLVPSRYGPDGWHDRSHQPYTWPQPMRMQELAHLYHASMFSEDYELITRTRAGDIERDWNHVPCVGEKNFGDTEHARFQYYDGLHPQWPEEILRAEYQLALEAYERVRLDDRDVETLVADSLNAPNPVYTKGLTQITMGAPQSAYNGGLLRATIRYFSFDGAGRPGLPADVAALVDELKPDRVGVELVNLNRDETRVLIVQSGAFGEHQFTEINYRDGDSERVVPVNEKYFAVQLPPSAAIRVEAGIRRFVNDPSYAFPWHGDRIPVPFQ